MMGESHIRYVTGDATHPMGTSKRIVAQVCNHIGAWGAGFTLGCLKTMAASSAGELVL